MDFFARDGRKRVMVVEDDPERRALYAEFLRAHAFDVIACEDGAEALRRMSTARNIDLILLDLGLPRMSGQEFLAALEVSQSADRRTPVVVLTGQRARVPGAVATLTKPAREDHLLQAIEQALTSAA